MPFQGHRLKATVLGTPNIYHLEVGGERKINKKIRNPGLRAKSIVHILHVAGESINLWPHNLWDADSNR